MVFLLTEKKTTNKAIWNWIFYKPINLLYFSCCVDNFSQIKLLDFEESVSDSKLELRRMILQLVSSMFFSQYTEISYNSTKSLINTCLAYKLTPPIQSRNMHQGAVQTNRYGRSEEHTSELQSHSDLVCRLLLEKKNKDENSLLGTAHYPAQLSSMLSPL